MAIIDYTPPPTLREFIRDYRPGELFYDWVVGPVGSGKTTAIFMKLCYMAMLQAPGLDGIRRSRAVIVRNTMPQLRDTTLTSWGYWFKDGEAGEWHASTNTFVLRFGDVECEVLFRPLDTPQDIARVLSLEVTFAIIDEFVQIPREIIDALSARLGRYPSAKDGGATNFGMWGSSNPDTEDNWWFDYLTANPAVEVVNPYTDEDTAATLAAKRALMHQTDVTANAKYFLQPSGFSDLAENLENLLQTSETLKLPIGDPARRARGRSYYVNQAKGKSKGWVKQFIEAEWGYSASGMPVIPSFNGDLHVAKSRLKFNPGLPLIVGLDPGLGGSAMIIGQQDAHGRLLVLGELVQAGYSAERMINQRLKPYLRARFPNLNLSNVIIAPDPAAANRAQTDEKTVVQIFAKHFKVSYESNNRLPLRLDAINAFTGRLTDVGAALQIDPFECPTLIRALKGGWRFEKATKHDGMKRPTPEDNPYTHPGDAFGYLCRFFQRKTDRELRHSGGSGNFRPPRSFGGSSYHVR